MLQVQLQDAFKADADTGDPASEGRTGQGQHRFRRNVAQRSAIRWPKPTPSRSISTAFRRRKAGDFRKIVNDNFSNAWILTPVNSTDYRMTMQPSYALKLKQDTLTQSISTIDNKINGWALSEATRAAARRRRTAEAEILVQLPGVDDPARVQADSEDTGGARTG